MKLRELRVRNLKLMRDFELSFVDPRTDAPRQWTILVGRNGTGKSTVLQAIALAAAGGGLANSLARSDVGSFADRRLAGAPGDAAGARTDEGLEIIADFDLARLGQELRVKPNPIRPRPAWLDQRQPSALRSILRLPRRGSLFTAEERLVNAGADVAPPAGGAGVLDGLRSQSAPWWFVAGYGTQRFLTTDTRKADRPHEQRLDSLFTARSGPLIGLGFADRQSYPPAFVKKFLEILKAVLVGPPEAQGAGGLTPLITNLELRGAGGVSSTDLSEKDRFEVLLPGTDGIKIPATYLSHGYQSTIAWVADLIGQFLLDFADDKVMLGKLKRESLTGLVLIDELDLFLHPDWQSGFIDALTWAFPHMQFVATTHSPLLIGARRPEEVVLLDWDATGNVVPRAFDGDPRLMNTGELYRRIFGLHDTPPTPLAQTVAQYNFMAGDPERTDEEEAEVQRLRATLDAAGVRDLEPLVPRRAP